MAQPQQRDRGSTRGADALLLWIRSSVAKYEGVTVPGFSAAAWSDGLALCALIHHHRPEAIQKSWDELAKMSSAERLTIAIQCAREKLEIESPVEPRDLLVYQQSEGKDDDMGEHLKPLMMGYLSQVCI